MRNLLFAVAFVFASAAFAAPETGKPAPDFSAKGADGKTYKLKELAGKTVVLEWYNKDCPYVRKHYDSKNMQKLQKDATGKGVVWLTVASSKKGKEGFMDEAVAKKAMTDNGLNSTTVLLDGDAAMAKAYGAKTTPHMFVIDKKGLLAYQGAIDDKPSANAKTLEGANNYVAAALISLEKGEPVKEGSTTPYGCSVKY